MPTNERFHVAVLWPQINGVHRYAKEIQQVFSSAKREVTASAAGLTFGHAISFTFSQIAYGDKTKRSPEAVKLLGPLDQAEIQYEVAAWTNLIVPYVFIVDTAE